MGHVPEMVAAPCDWRCDILTGDLNGLSDSNSIFSCTTSSCYLILA